MATDRIEILKKFLEEDPNDSFVRFALAKEYEKQGTLKAAIDTFTELMRRDPDYIGLYYHLGGLYTLIGNKKTAKQIFQKGIDKAKKMADFHALSELHTAIQDL